jgi:PIN domain nuclease of toxin-antitoxin system
MSASRSLGGRVTAVTPGVIFLDATAVLALLMGEPGAPDVEALLREGDASTTAVNYAEVVGQATRVHGKALGDLDRALTPLVDRGILRISEVDAAVGRHAGEVRALRYDRQRSPLSLADCLLLGAARAADAMVATSDQVLADAAAAEGLTVRGVRNSRGVRPTRARSGS